ncbi:MAG: TetR family transcriptional regulator [Ktedonobacteraceae bacterium]|nr:TetR family transcriptional regulator [Ktedonobacteraceae bacterium]
MIKYICQDGAPKIEDNKGRGAVHKPIVTPNKPVASSDKPVKRERITQQAIVAAAARLFAQKGFGATSLEDIADVLGATKGALYYHVKNKEEILRLIYMMVLTVSEEPLRRIVEADTPPQEKLRRAIEHQTTVAADRSPAMTVFFREQHHLTGPFAKEILLRKKVYERYFERIIEEGQQAGVFKADVDAKMIAFGLLGMCNSLSQWYHAAGSYTPQSIAAMFENIFATGLQG